MDIHQEETYERMIHIISQQTALPTKSFRYNKLYLTRLISENILLILLQYMGLMISALSTSQPTIWFASGTACGLLFMRGYTITPGIWIGTFIAYSLAHTSFSISLIHASVFTLQSILLLYAVQRLISPTLLFYQLETFIKFIAITLLLSIFTCACLIPIASLTIWLSSVAANFAGITIVASALVTWDMYFPSLQQLSKRDIIKFSIPHIFYFMSIVALLCSVQTAYIILFAFMTLPLSIIISLQQGWCGAILASFSFALLFCLGNYLNLPLFSASFALPVLFYLQLVVIEEAIVGLFIAISGVKNTC